MTARTFANPPAAVRPGTRWWWDQSLNPTATFSVPDGLAEVDAFADAGFGRFEIAWESGNYGTAPQRAALKAIAKRARQRGLQLDMTLGPAWPWNSPTAQGRLGYQELQYGRTDVAGPTTYSDDVPNAIGDDSPRGTLTAVTAARVVRSGPAVTAADSEPPASSTVLDPRSLVDLTPKVRGTHLDWKVPAGHWILFAFWQRTPTTCGKYTKSAGQCVSLIDRASNQAGVTYVETHQVGDAAGAVTGPGYSFFEDSPEFDEDELYWSSAFLREFTSRRGYDVRKYLPLLFVQTLSEVPTPTSEPVPDFDLPRGEGARFRHDYNETLTDLYASAHLEFLGTWARKYGMKFRTQPAYGNNFDLTRSARIGAESGVLVDTESLFSRDAGVSPIAEDLPVVGDFPLPEVGPHGQQPYELPDSPDWRFAMEHYRQVTSGAAQGDGLEVSSELGDSFFYDLHTSLRDYQRMMNKEWAAGVTRPIFHGYTHTPASTPWPGAAHFGGIVGESLNKDGWPEWTNMGPLSDYFARGALVLQQGAARTDVAVLRDSFANADGINPLSLETAGFTVGYVDPVGLATRKTGPHGELYPTGPSYRTLVVDDTQTYVGPGRMPGATARAIDVASAKGLKVVFVGQLPSRGTGGRNPAREDRAVRRAVRRILARPTATHVRSQRQLGRAATRLGVRPASAWSKPARVYSQRRETKRATYYYLWNATGRAQSVTGSFAATGAPSRLDLWNGSVEPIVQYATSRARTSLPVRLAPYGTTVIKFTKGTRRAHLVASTAGQVSATRGGRVEVRDAHGGPQRLRLSTGGVRRVVLPHVTDRPLVVGGAPLGGWNLQVRTYGPEGQTDRPALPLLRLADWRDIPGLTTESGIGTYTARVTVPATWVGRSRGSLLSLGALEGSVRVFVNGRLVTHDLDPQAPVDVTRYLRAGDNTVKVVLATTPSNKAIVSPTVFATRPLFAASIARGSQAYGLLGPVRLIPYARSSISLRGGAA